MHISSWKPKYLRTKKVAIPPTYAKSGIPSFCWDTTYIYEFWWFYRLSQYIKGWCQYEILADLWKFKFCDTIYVSVLWGNLWYFMISQLFIDVIFCRLSQSIWTQSESFLSSMILGNGSQLLMHWIPKPFASITMITIESFDNPDILLMDGEP